MTEDEKRLLDLLRDWLGTSETEFPTVCEHGIDHAQAECPKCIGQEMDEAFFGER